jgi:hypothetical protein
MEHPEPEKPKTMVFQMPADDLKRTRGENTASRIYKVWPYLEFMQNKFPGKTIFIDLSGIDKEWDGTIPPPVQIMRNDHIIRKFLDRLSLPNLVIQDRSDIEKLLEIRYDDTKKYITVLCRLVETKEGQEFSIYFVLLFTIENNIVTISLTPPTTATTATITTMVDK